MKTSWCRVENQQTQPTLDHIGGRCVYSLLRNHATTTTPPPPPPYPNPMWTTWDNTMILFVSSPKFCISIVFVFSWDHCKSQERETGNNACAKFVGTDKDYYGIFRSGLSSLTIGAVVFGLALFLLNASLARSQPKLNE